MVTINGVGFATDPKKAGIGRVETLGPGDGKKSINLLYFGVSQN